MGYTIEWREAPWLLMLTTRGSMNVEQYRGQIHDMQRYLDGADGHLYWVFDLDLGSVDATGLNAELMQEMIGAPLLSHPNCGQIAIVGDKLVRFVIQIIAQAPAMKNLPGGVPMRVFGSLEEAEQFCREVATVDQRRATKCEPLAQS